MSGIIKLSPGEAIRIKSRWNEIAEIANTEEYYREAGKLLEETMKMYKQILAATNESQQVSLTEDTLTLKQLEELDKVREEILQKIEREQIFKHFITVLSSISEKTSKLGGRKSNKRTRSRSQNKRYSRRRCNVGKRRQYSSRRK
jgi:vacuolar-type H+-ATPase subunit I/STV1